MSLARAALAAIATCATCATLVVRAEDARPAAGSAFDPGRLSWSVHVSGFDTDYRELALFALPGETVTLRPSRPVEAEADSGTLSRSGGLVRWKAPGRAGPYPVRLRAGDETMTLRVFVLRPATEIRDGELDGYRIGSYPVAPFRDLPSYHAPKGFVELRPELLDTPVSPHFTLGQFRCKQDAGWPQFLVLDPVLLLKLERALERVNARGIRADRFEVMSGYRTPYYNRAIGNKTTHSRHVYGAAADIYVDVAPPDGQMDDLDGDGRSTKADADLLYDLLEEFSVDSWWQRHLGGLASYRPNAAHGPFVHVDTRGYRARWGR